VKLVVDREWKRLGEHAVQSVSYLMDTCVEHERVDIGTYAAAKVVAQTSLLFLVELEALGDI